MPNLVEMHAKLARASQHFAELTATFQGFLENGAYSSTLEVDDEGWYHLRWRVNHTPPVELATIYADILANLRSAFDYLVTDLVILAGNKVSKQTAFPCVKVAKEWKSTWGVQLRGVAGRWVSEIDRLQPYHVPVSELHWLAILNDVNNITKHATLPPIVMNWERHETRMEGNLGGCQMEFQSFPNTPVTEGAEFFRVRLHPRVADFRMRPIGHQSFSLAFQDGLGRGGWTIADLSKWVNDSVVVFESAFLS